MLLSALHIDYPRQVVTLSTTIMEGHRAAEPIMDLVTTFALLVSAFSLVSTKHTAELPHRLTKIHKNSLPSYFNNTEHTYEYIQNTPDKIEKLLRNYFLCNFWEMFHHQIDSVICALVTFYQQLCCCFFCCHVPSASERVDPRL